VYTNPDHVFTAHNGENLALVCWIQGDLWHSTYSGRTDVIWNLVIDRDQSNSRLYQPGGCRWWATPGRCDDLFTTKSSAMLPTWIHATPRIYTDPAYVFRRGQGHVDLMVCYINGDLDTGATGNTTAKWDLIIDKYLDNAAGYLNDADIHGYTNNYCGQPVRYPRAAQPRNWIVNAAQDSGLGGLGCG
jgi:hypothetical protein